MKRLAVLTISLLTAAAAFGGTAAYAEEAKAATVYPADNDFIKTLTFSSLSDYAVSGDTYAFADGKTVYVYEDGKRQTFTLNERAVNLDCSRGKFYYSYADGTVCSLPETSAEEYTVTEDVTSEYVMSKSLTSIDTDNYTYKLTGTDLEVADFVSKDFITFEGKYSCLKQYDENIYAVKNNALYAFKGSKEEKIVLEYADYSSTEKIAVGQAADGLQHYGTLTFVEIQAGSYMTEVDLTSLDGEYFKSGKTLTANENTIALLLCYSGNSAVVAIGDTSYVLLKSKTHETTVKCEAENDFDTATIIGNRIYASPYVIIGTSVSDGAAGAVVKVTRKLRLEGVLGSVFYEVTTLEGEPLGYVAEGFLTKYIIEDNKEPAVKPDPVHSEKTNTTPIILVFLVVLLVLMAIGYLAYVSTKGKNKKAAAEGQTQETKNNKAKKNKKK